MINRTVSKDNLNEISQFIDANLIWRKYQPRLFLENLMTITKLAEDANMTEDIEPIYNAIGELLILPRENDYFCIYNPSRNCCCRIVTQENSRELKHGTTGLFSWPAAISLVRNLDFLNFRELIEGKIVAELGCGVGLLGLSCLIFCQPKNFIFTDHSHEVLQKVELNLSLNISDCDLRCTRHEFIGDNYEIDCIDFCEHDVAVIDADVLVGSDIVFDPNMVPPLCGYLNSFLISGSDRKCFIACTVRAQETFDLFLDGLSSFKLNTEIVELKDDNSEQDIKLLIISIKSVNL